MSPSPSSRRRSSDKRPAWVSPRGGSHRGLEPSSPLSRSARPYSPTRETWFGAADKECGVGARQRQAEQLEADFDKSRAKQHARVARMKHVGAQPAPATAPSVYPRGGKATPTRKQAPARRQADITPSPKKKTKKAQRPKGSPAKEQRRIFFGTLPEGWESATSQSTGDVFFVNTITNESQYERPTQPATAQQTPPARERAGGRSGEDWAEDVMRQLAVAPQPEPRSEPRAAATLDDATLAGIYRRVHASET